MTQLPRKLFNPPFKKPPFKNSKNKSAPRGAYSRIYGKFEVWTCEQQLVCLFSHSLPLPNNQADISNARFSLNVFLIPGCFVFNPKIILNFFFSDRRYNFVCTSEIVSLTTDRLELFCIIGDILSMACFEKIFYAKLKSFVRDKISDKHFPNIFCTIFSVVRNYFWRSLFKFTFEICPSLFYFYIYMINPKRNLMSFEIYSP